MPVVMAKMPGIKRKLDFAFTRQIMFVLRFLFFFVQPRQRDALPGGDFQTLMQPVLFEVKGVGHGEGVPRAAMSASNSA